MSDPSSVFSLTALAEEHSSKVAIISPDKAYTYSELLLQIQQLIYVLKKNNIRAGERVALLCLDKMHFCLLSLALWYAGVIVVPLSTRESTRALRQQLHTAFCSRLLMSPEVDISKFKKWRPILIDNIFAQTRKNFEEKQNLNLFVQQEASILFTSGSAGMAKAVLHTIGNHFYSARGSNNNIVLEEDDSWLFSLPAYHIGGIAIVFRILLAGAGLAIPSDGQDLSNSIQELDVSHISVVPTQLYRLLENDNNIRILKKLKAVLVGGTFLPGKLVDQAFEEGLPVFTTYGSTEMASQITTTAPNDTCEKLHTSGKVLANREARITAEGEIAVKGDSCFKGYVEGDKLQRPFDTDGWFLTGDIGHFDTEGYLHVKGRKDNMFISGGENIYPEEIETWLLQLPQIENAVVVDIPDKEFGSRPVAFILTTAEESIDSADIKSKLLLNLPRFKIPDRFFPLSENLKGIKVNRKALQKIALQKTDYK